ncbi:S-adenosyl-L-methionine-dependent methyltransferase [Chytriomyces sp. MP71]|nr:S-adenosyl-L-methionine-dependent methyltransferase [Chytriomyces sp. MP71]
MPAFNFNAILVHVRQHATRGNPRSVIAALDDYGYKIGWHMSVGDVKGAIVDGLVRQHKPKLMVEIGAFVGYSAVRFASLLPEGARYVSFEVDPAAAQTAAEMVEFAGLSSVCTIVVGDFKETVGDVIQKGTVDMFFIDHWKEVYLRDFKVIEDLGLCHEDSVVVADNVITPGAPDYLKYVAKSKSVKSTRLIDTVLEYTSTPDGISVSIMN